MLLLYLLVSGSQAGIDGLFLVDFVEVFQVVDDGVRVLELLDLQLYVMLPFLVVLDLALELLPLLIKLVSLLVYQLQAQVGAPIRVVLDIVDQGSHDVYYVLYSVVLFRVE